MASARQDMPPAGGYQRIHWERVPAKALLSSYSLFGGFFVCTFGGLYLFYLNSKQVKRHDLEVNDARLSVEPLLLAERDREFLKQVRRNRDEETKLMKNVPGWQTGTYYGEPIYKSIPRDAWIDPILDEYYAHTDPYEIHKNVNIHFRQ